jgi:hypothetical protein
MTTAGNVDSKAVQLVDLSQAKSRADFVELGSASATGVVCAQKVAIVHGGQKGPHSIRCLNCDAGHQCVVHRHSRELLNAAGWDDERIDAMVRRAHAGSLPWPVRSTGWRR